MSDELAGCVIRSRMNNCGPGSNAREVFRTPLLGTAVIFDLRETLSAGCCWIGAALRSTSLKTLTPRAIAEMSRALLEHLGIDPPPRLRDGGEDARSQLQVLTRQVVASGRARTCVGVAYACARAIQSASTPPGVHGQAATATQTFRPSSALDVALTIGVYAVFAPPLILWTRTPSLRWFSSNTLIVLRRFGTGAEEAV
jgi:hypothetical protein